MTCMLPLRRWGELHVCSVGEVVGPPYSLETVVPGSGAITGATEAMVRYFLNVCTGDGEDIGISLVGQIRITNADITNQTTTPVMFVFSQITGMGFSSVSGAVSVRFACPKGFVESEGQVVSDTEVSFLTPSFEKFGPMQV